MYFYDDEEDDDDMSLDYMPLQQPREDASPPVPPPSQETVEQRLHFRRSIKEKTLEHRRVEVHGGMGDTGRNIARVLRDRERCGARHAILEQSPKTKTGRSMTYPMTVSWELQTFSEYSSVTRYHSAYLSHLGGNTHDVTLDSTGTPSSISSVSTISIAFSPDSQTMASTHGDHTVKITSCNTGILLQTLEGHPRTPWTVKYHPTNMHILASGCLGCQVRVWNWKDGICLKMIRLDHAIISLSFHPSGHVLAIASGSRLHFWDYANYAGGDGNADSRGALIEVEQRHMLRCVHFPPNGNTLIVGGSNPPTEEQRRRRSGMPSGGMSFYLRLWDFDLTAALHPEERDARDVLTTLRHPRKALGNPRTFVPRALLYNDGGFDVSPDGSTLCACAEYWLPDDVNSAMELLQREELVEEPPDEDGMPTDDARSISTPESKITPESSPSRHSMSTRSVSTPVTPPNPGGRVPLPLSPPPPPGLRFTGGMGNIVDDNNESTNPSLLFQRTLSRFPPAQANPHPLSIVSGSLEFPDVAGVSGRYVPHVVTVSLDTSPVTGDSTNPAPRYNVTSVARGYRPRLGQLLEAAPLDGSKAAAVTCVKFSPSADFCLLGYGVREPAEGGQHHPVTALYRVIGGMTHISTMLSGDDDVNIARFHPDSGYGFVYGTKQGRVRVLSPRPWNYYNC